jgi:predicted HTH domain antitoxin
MWINLPVTISTRVDEELVHKIDEIAMEENLDRATILRRFISESVIEYSIKKNLEEYQDGKLSLWQAANKCELSLWEMVEEARKREFYLPYSLEDLAEDIDAL